MWRIGSTARLLFIAALGLVAPACGTAKYMKEMPAGSALQAPGPGKAMVVFMRSSLLSKAAAASIFELKNNDPKLVGMVANDTKLAYEADPGKCLFMVVSGSADYMWADLAANRTYYVFVTPRMGAFRARFFLTAVSRSGDRSSDARECLKDCRLVARTPAAESWASENMSDIRAKHRENYPRWNQKPDNEKAHLAREDGV